MSVLGGLPPSPRIVVRCPNWLGDVVMATAGLRALRAARPDATIVGHLPAPFEPLIDGAGLFDELWPVDSRQRGWRALHRDVRRVARGRFDLGIAIPESISSALILRAGRVGRAVGFARDPIRRALLDQVVPAPEAWGRRRLVSRERFVLTLMAELGAPSVDTRLALRVTGRDRERLAVALEALGGEGARLSEAAPIVLAPGASFGESKCWPAESYAALADRLAGRGEPIVLVGTMQESARLAAVRDAMTERPIVLAGRLDLGGLKALLERAALLVANDAGTRHVAAALGVPSVVFFGPTSVAKTADNLEAVEVLEREHECRPCYRRTCPIDHRCLRGITAEDAEQAVDRALARTPAGRGIDPLVSSAHVARPRARGLGAER